MLCRYPNDYSIEENRRSLHSDIEIEGLATFRDPIGMDTISPFLQTCCILTNNLTGKLLPNAQGTIHQLGAVKFGRRFSISDLCLVVVQPLRSNMGSLSSFGFPIEHT